jgi:hypothetical protein
LEMDAASSHVGPALQQRRRARQPGSHLGFSQGRSTSSN